jgi:predicted Rossmann fold flavoprotein
MREERLVVVGGGAAGLFAAIAAAEAGVPPLVLEGEGRLGAKILVSGGGRCNVTNATVTESDFHGSTPAAIRRLLRRFPAVEARRFFEETGVQLVEEEGGKLFPASGRARDVLDALLRRARSGGVRIECGRRVVRIEPREGRWEIEGREGEPLRCERVVLATGGASLPKSGSDGFGFELLRRLGHGVVPPVPALVPLVLDSTFFHGRLAGVSLPVALDLRRNGRRIARTEGPLLWTHFGISGPSVLDLSVSFERARLDDPEGVGVHLNLLPGESFESLERAILDETKHSPRRGVRGWLAGRLPDRLADCLLEIVPLSASERFGTLSREGRRRLLHSLTALPLPVVGSRGWDQAETTSGGIPLAETTFGELESRLAPGLHLAGELLDVDGRLGGFNFQWAWVSGRVAGRGAAVLAAPGGPSL